LRESDNSTVIGDAPERRSNSLQVLSWKQRNNTVFLRAGRDPMRRWSNDPIVSHPKTGNKIRKTWRKRDASSRTISANGIEIFLLEQGEGPLVLFCHGWLNYPFLAASNPGALRAAGFHVVAPV